jgi:pilus assembly protein Flp/PilA
MNPLDLLERLVREDAGQDLVEYALLIGMVTVAGVLLLPTLPAKMGTAFGNWGTNVLNLWVPSAPAP